MKISEGLRYTLKAARRGYPEQVELIRTFEPDSSDLRYAKIAFGIGSGVFIGGSVFGLAYSVPREVDSIRDAQSSFQQAEFPNLEDSTSILVQTNLIALESLLLAHGLAQLQTARAAVRRQGE